MFSNSVRFSSAILFEVQKHIVHHLGTCYFLDGYECPLIDKKDLTEEDHLLMGMRQLRQRGSAGQQEQQDEQLQHDDQNRPTSGTSSPATAKDDGTLTSDVSQGEKSRHRDTQLSDSLHRQEDGQPQQQRQRQQQQQPIPAKTISPSHSDSSLASAAEARRSSSSASSTAMSASGCFSISGGSSASSSIGHSSSSNAIGSSGSSGGGSGVGSEASCGSSGGGLPPRRHGGVSIPLIMADDVEDDE